MFAQKKQLEQSDRKYEKASQSILELERSIRILSKEVREAERNMEYYKHEATLNNEIREKLEKRVTVLLEDNAQLDYTLQNSLDKIRNL